MESYFGLILFAAGMALAYSVGRTRSAYQLARLEHELDYQRRLAGFWYLTYREREQGQPYEGWRWN